MFSNFIWGVVLILLGCSLLLKSVFGIAIPFFRIIGGAFLIYAGLCMITNLSPKKFFKERNSIKFEEKRITSARDIQDGDQFHILFGKGFIDLSDLPQDTQSKNIKIDTVFGTTTLKINPNIPTKIKVNAGFASSAFPSGTVVNFGKHTYRTHDRSIKPKLFVKADVAFGSFNIEKSED